MPAGLDRRTLERVLRSIAHTPIVGVSHHDDTPYDTNTWGQTATFDDKATNAGILVGAPAIVQPRQQVVRALYDRPTSWTLKFFFTFERPVGENGVFTVSWTIMLGVGQTRLVIPRSFTATNPSSGGITTVEPLSPGGQPYESVPGQAINIDAQVTIGPSGGNAVLAGPHQVVFQACVAPVVE